MTQFSYLEISLWSELIKESLMTKLFLFKNVVWTMKLEVLLIVTENYV